MGSWLAIGDDREQHLLRMLVQGMSDVEIEKTFIDMGFDQITSTDIAAYRRLNRDKISEAVIANVQAIAQRTKTRKGEYRVGLLDNDIEMLGQIAVEYKEGGEGTKAARVLDIRAKLLRQVGEEVGRLPTAPQQNTAILILQNITDAGKRQKALKMFRAADEAQKGLMSGLDELVEAEYTIEDVTDDNDDN